MTLLKGLEFKLGFVPLFYLPVPRFLSGRFSYIDLAFVTTAGKQIRHRESLMTCHYQLDYEFETSFVTSWRHPNNLLLFFRLKQLKIIRIRGEVIDDDWSRNVNKVLAYNDD